MSVCRKSGTAVVTAWTFFYGLFYIDYGPHEHVFTDLQRWYRQKLDGLLGIDVAQAISQKKQISDGRGDDNCTINEIIVDIPKVVVEEGNTTKIVSASEQEGANRKWWWR